MSDHSCRLIFRGEIRGGLDPILVRSAVRKLLGCEEAAMERLFSGRPVVIKSKLDPRTALKFKTLFEKTGALCHIAPQHSAPSVPTQHPAPALTCPKCGFQQPEGISCVSCGVVIEKYRQRQAADQTIAGPEGDAAFPGIPDAGSGEAGAAAAVPTWSSDPAAFLKEFLLPSGTRSGLLVIGLKALLLLGLLIWGSRFVFSSIAGNYAGESFMHLVNLPFHEAGHVIFRPLGTFMTSLGGSLSQVLFPLVCLSALLLKARDAFGAAVCLWWTGQNFIDLAPYIDDARAGVLPLLGGNTGQTSPYGFHDWEFILTESGLLRFDHTLARFSHAFGAALMALAILWAGAVLYGQYRNTRNG